MEMHPADALHNIEELQRRYTGIHGRRATATGARRRVRRQGVELGVAEKSFERAEGVGQQRVADLDAKMTRGEALGAGDLHALRDAERGVRQARHATAREGALLKGTQAIYAATRPAQPQRERYHGTVAETTHQLIAAIDADLQGVPHHQQQPLRSVAAPTASAAAPPSVADEVSAGVLRAQEAILVERQLQAGLGALAGTPRAAAAPQGGVQLQRAYPLGAPQEQQQRAEGGVVHLAQSPAAAAGLPHQGVPALQHGGVFETRGAVPAAAPAVFGGGGVYPQQQQPWGVGAAATAAPAAHPHHQPAAEFATPHLQLRLPVNPTHNVQFSQRNGGGDVDVHFYGATGAPPPQPGLALLQQQQQQAPASQLTYTTFPPAAWGGGAEAPPAASREAAGLSVLPPGSSVDTASRGDEKKKKRKKKKKNSKGGSKGVPEAPSTPPSSSSASTPASRADGATTSSGSTAAGGREGGSTSTSSSSSRQTPPSSSNTTPSMPFSASPQSAGLGGGSGGAAADGGGAEPRILPPHLEDEARRRALEGGAGAQGNGSSNSSSSSGTTPQQPGVASDGGRRGQAGPLPVVPPSLPPGNGGGGAAESAADGDGDGYSVEASSDSSSNIPASDAEGDGVGGPGQQQAGPDDAPPGGASAAADSAPEPEPEPGVGDGEEDGPGAAPSSPPTVPAAVASPAASEDGGGGGGSSPSPSSSGEAGGAEGGDGVTEGAADGADDAAAVAAGGAEGGTAQSDAGSGEGDGGAGGGGSEAEQSPGAEPAAAEKAGEEGGAAGEAAAQEKGEDEEGGGEETDPPAAKAEAEAAEAQEAKDEEADAEAQKAKEEEAAAEAARQSESEAEAAEQNAKEEAEAAKAEAEAAVQKAKDDEAAADAARQAEAQAAAAKQEAEEQQRQADEAAAAEAQRRADAEAAEQQRQADEAAAARKQEEAAAAAAAEAEAAEQRRRDAEAAAAEAERQAAAEQERLRQEAEQQRAEAEEQQRIAAEKKRAEEAAAAAAAAEAEAKREAEAAIAAAQKRSEEEAEAARQQAAVEAAEREQRRMEAEAAAAAAAAQEAAAARQREEAEKERQRAAAEADARRKKAEEEAAERERERAAAEAAAAAAAAEAEAKRRAAAERERQRAEEEQQRAEAEAQRKAEEEALRRKAEEEQQARRRAAEAEAEAEAARKKSEEAAAAEARRQRDEAAAAAAAESARKAAEELKKAEEAAAAEATRKKAADVAQRKAEADAKAKQRAADEARREAAEARKREEAETARKAEAAEAESRAANAAAPPLPPVGSHVELHSYKNTPQHNGRRGIIREHRDARDGSRCAVVEFPGNEKQMVKAENLRPDPNAPALHPVGAKVVLHGFVNTKDLNGLVGSVAGHANAPDGEPCMQVSIPNRKPAMVRMKNAKLAPQQQQQQPAPTATPPGSTPPSPSGSAPPASPSSPKALKKAFPLGSKVVLQDFDNTPEFNGWEGKVVGFKAGASGEMCLGVVAVGPGGEERKLLVRQKNARPFTKADKSKPPQPAAPQGPKPGTTLEIHSLQKNAALNGAKVEVVQPKALPDGTPVVLVRLPDGATELIKVSNTRPVGPASEAAAPSGAGAGGAAAAPAAGAAAKPPSGPMHPVGSAVEIHSLQKLKELNGTRGVVAAHKITKDGTHCMVINFGDGKKQLVKPDNARLVPPESTPSAPVTPAAAAPSPSATATATAPTLHPVGTAVELHSLKDNSGLNGRAGRVVAHSPDHTGTPCLAVQIEGQGKPRLVSMENTRKAAPKQQQQQQVSQAEKPAGAAHPDPLPVGTAVELHSLKKLADLNGRTGKVVGHKTLKDGERLMVVQIPGRSEPDLVRMANVRPDSAAAGGAPAATAAPAPAPPAAAPPALFPVGSTVEVHSYAGKPQFNGRFGKVKAHQRDPRSSAPEGAPDGMLVEFHDGRQAFIPASNARKPVAVPGPPTPPPAAEPTRHDIPLGSRVEVHSLEKASQFNGKQGKVVKYKTTEAGVDTLILEMDDGSRQMVKPQNTKPAATGPADAAPTPTPASSQPKQDSVLPVGSTVELHSLKNKAELNGKRGKVKAHKQRDGETLLSVDLGMLGSHMVRPSNARAADGAAPSAASPKPAAALHPPGSTVEVHSLVNLKELNGRRARVVSHEISKDGAPCLLAEFPDKSKTLLKMSNAKLVAPPPQKQQKPASGSEAAPPAAPPAAAAIPVGSTVQVQGLVKAANFNGKRGKVVSGAVTKDGVECLKVRLESGTTELLKKDNLKVLATPAATTCHPVGSKVELIGLIAAGHLNGQRGEVIELATNKGEQVMRVKLTIGSKQLLRPANAKLLDNV